MISAESIPLCRELEREKTMQYVSEYDSPVGCILLASDETGLCGLWFQGQKYDRLTLQEDCRHAETRVIRMAKKWLDNYFQNQVPDLQIPLHLQGTHFQKTVWAYLLTIPYGTTATYADCAKAAAAALGKKRMSAQAAAGAIARNPVSILVPCHRVIGTDGKLHGYAGGLDKKEYLLRLEQQTAKTAK